MEVDWTSLENFKLINIYLINLVTVNMWRKDRHDKYDSPKKF